MSRSSTNIHTQLLQKSKQQLMEASTRNCLKRLNRILDIVNQLLPESFEPFIINQNNTKQIFQDIKTCILSWKGNEITNSSKQNSYTQASIQWFTKNNAKIYGNCLFYPAFVYILRFCNDINKLNNNNKIHLLTSIILKLLNSNIKSINNQPLIPIQCLLYPNTFITILKQFISHFYMEFQIDTLNISTITLLLNGLLDKIESNLSTNSNVQFNLFTLQPLTAPTVSKIESKSTDSEITVLGIPLLPQLQSTSPLITSINSNSNISVPNYINHLLNDDTVNKDEETENKDINSIIVPINENQRVEYKIISFAPLRVEEVIL